MVASAKVRSKYILPRKYKLMACDEAHAIKNFKSARFKAVQEIGKTCEGILLMSGTPFNFSSELFSTLQLLPRGIRLFPRFFNYKSEPDDSFAWRYCKPVQVFHQWTFRGYDRQDELQSVLWAMMLRRRKKDILPQLPAKLRTSILLEPLPEPQLKEIKKLLDAEEAKNGRDRSYMESFRLTCQYKIPKVLHFLTNHLKEDLMANDSSLKVLIFFHHQLMLEALKEWCETHQMSYFFIDASVSPEKRFELQEKFQSENGPRIALLSIMAAGSGLTLTAARVVVFTELLFSPEHLLQSEDRAHRVQQKSDVNVLYLIQPNTCDYMNWLIVKKKERETSHMIDCKANHLQNSFAELRPDVTLTETLKRRAEHVAPDQPAVKRLVTVRRTG